MNIQITDIQKGKFCMIIHGVTCVFMPMALFTEDQFLPLEMKMKPSGTLGWYVARQIKKAILKALRRQ